MTHHNAANERIKCQYFAYLAEALWQSEATIDAVAIRVNTLECAMKISSERLI